jgi:hypothetical protein
MVKHRSATHRPPPVKTTERSARVGCEQAKLKVFARGLIGVGQIHQQHSRRPGGGSDSNMKPRRIWTPSGSKNARTTITNSR